MESKLPSELQRSAVHGVILFFEGHVFKALGNSFVPSGSHHIFAFDWKVWGRPTPSRGIYWQLPRRRGLGLVIILNID